MTGNLSQAPVVLAADGTPSSDGALQFAVQEASVRGTALVIVHVNPVHVPPPPLLRVPAIGPVATRGPVVPSALSQHARHVLERIEREVKDLAPGLRVSTVLAEGRRARAIVDVASNAQLVVVGRETRHGLERVLTSATTAGVAAHARCPVAVVPSDWQPRNEPAGGTVVVGIRRVSDAPALMATAHDWASRRGGSLRVVHAWEMADPYVDRIEGRTHYEEWKSLGEQLLAEALADWRRQHPDVPFETRVIHGQAASVLVDSAKEADLVVVRRAHDSRPFDHLGATVRALLLASPAPVEVVPSYAGSRPEPDLALEDSGAVAT